MGVGFAWHVLVVPAANAASSAPTQPLRSLPSVEWPVFATLTNRAPGIAAATRRACSTGVRRSAEPSRMSVGTFGSAPSAGAGSGASGHEAQRSRTLCVSGTPRPNGAKADAGRLLSDAAACSTRSPDELAGFHGKLVSLHRVAVKSVVFTSSPAACRPARRLPGTEPLSPAARARRRRIGVRSPRSAARAAPGSSARSVGLRSPASSVCHRPTAVRRMPTRVPSGR